MTKIDTENVGPHVEVGKSFRYFCFTFMPHDLHQGGERIEGMKPDFVELGFFYAVFI